MTYIIDLYTSEEEFRDRSATRRTRASNRAKVGEDVMVFLHDWGDYIQEVGGHAIIDISRDEEAVLLKHASLILERIQLNGFDPEEFRKALDSNNDDRIAATHPSNWMHEEEVSSQVQNYVLDLIADGEPARCDDECNDQCWQSGHRSPRSSP